MSWDGAWKGHFNHVMGMGKSLYVYYKLWVVLMFKSRETNHAIRLSKNEGCCNVASLLLPQTHT